MGRNTSGLKRTAGPGRPKGMKNKATPELKAWATQLFHSPEWRKSAEHRIVTGKAPHLEGHVLQVLLPKTEKHQISGTATIQVVTGFPQPEDAR